MVNGTYLLNTIQFAGPCNGQVSFMVNAVIQAHQGRSNTNYWINFDNVDGLTIRGNGTLDGQGASAWPFNPCSNAVSCLPLTPVSSVFPRNSKNSLLKSLEVQELCFNLGRYFLSNNQKTGLVYGGLGPKQKLYKLIVRMILAEQYACLLNLQSLMLTRIKQSLVHNITLLNSKGFHMKIENCENITIKSITITSPADSPNTDGIHTGNIKYVNILNSSISTGDDCISMGAGTRNINITGVICGPGHGISIGSIGKYPSEQNVEGVNVRNCTMRSTQNGVRIKTWNSTFQLYVSDVTFQDIVMDNANNPIIIDQQYCGGRHDCIVWHLSGLRICILVSYFLLISH